MHFSTGELVSEYRHFCYNAICAFSENPPHSAKLYNLKITGLKEKTKLEQTVLNCVTL